MYICRSIRVDMEFIDREQELQLLEKTRQKSQKSAIMTVLLGRRRIGKTSLVTRAFDQSGYLYFFIARKNETLLCKDFVEEISTKLNLPVLGEFTQFSRLFEFILVTSQTRPITLIMDEFQEFYHINPAVYGEMQNLWDKYKSSAKLNLILSGSVHSLMKKIFKNTKEPLFGRANERIYLKPFTVNVLKKLLTGINPAWTSRDLLAMYTISGGVPKYVEHFIDNQAITQNDILNEIFRDNSLLLDEGMNLLIEEFGREYTTYFSILSLIASSKSSRSEIESILGKNTGGYLERLETDYHILNKIRPVFSKPGSRIQKYYIDDNFLGFWFRFVYKNRAALEIGNYQYVRTIVERDFEAFSGPYLEKYFREKLAFTGKYSLIGRYWEKGNLNEIDIVALNEMEKTVLIAEVKRKKTKIDRNRLQAKAAKLLQTLPDYHVSFDGFSLEEM